MDESKIIELTEQIRKLKEGQKIVANSMLMNDTHSDTINRYKKFMQNKIDTITKELVAILEA